MPTSTRSSRSWPAASPPSTSRRRSEAEPMTRPATNPLRVPRIIDVALWTRANPSGVAFLAPDDGPPGLGIVFRDAAAGVEIFERWLTELGPEDSDELIRVTITE